VEDFVNHRLLKKDTVIKRDYQLNLLAACSQENSLMVLPTGLGKTIVALLLTVLKLDKIPDQKVIFLAPTKPLVDQHYHSFSNLMALEPEMFACLTGSIPANKRNGYYSESKVFFMTPQVLQNDIIKGNLSMNDVSLVIFDECHRASGNYAYVFIAGEYVKQNPSGLILGMTASPGKNREKIEEILANLHLTNVEIKTDEDPDVKPYIFKRKEKWVDVELPEQLLRVINTLDKIMKDVQKELEKFGYLEKSDLSTGLSKTKMFNISKEIDTKINTNRDQNVLSELFYLKKLVSNAIRISHMTDLLEAQGIDPLLEYFNKNIKEIEDRKASKSAFELFASPEIQDIYQNLVDLNKNNVFHPKMSILKDLLEVQMLNNPNSRVLVFAHFRDTVSTILDYISDKELVNDKGEMLIRAERFVGQAKKGEEAGLSQKQQLDVLKRFKDGEINILVATSVAEEGLDIDECDLVIFFDIVPSEIRSIQRKGRTGRKKEGTIIMLKSAGTKEDAFFFIEKRREKQMKKILLEIKASKKQPIKKKSVLDAFETQDTNQGLNRFLKPKTTTKNTEPVPENNDVVNNKPVQQTKSTQLNQLDSINDSDVDGSIDYFDDLDSIEGLGDIEELDTLDDLNDLDSVEDYDDLDSINDLGNFDGQSGSNDESLNEFDDADGKDDANLTVVNKQSQFITGEDPMQLTVLVDNRELRSELVQILRDRNVSLVYDNYFTGDYIVSTRCAIERKSMEDLIASLKDSRLFDEIIKMKNSFEHAVLLVEGSISQIHGINPNALFGAMASIILKFNMSIIYTENSEQSADIIISLAKKEQFDDKKSVPIKVPKLPESDKGKIEVILSSFPKLNVTRARALLNHFGSLQNILNASENDLQEVPGIGKTIAKEIARISRLNYLDSK
jgi:Fanconi anemia group M protein